MDCQTCNGTGRCALLVICTDPDGEKRVAAYQPDFPCPACNEGDR